MTGAEQIRLRDDVRKWARELGFEQAGIADCDLSVAESRLKDWLDEGYHGDMDFMAAHGTRRTRPSELVAGTRRVISVRMNYMPARAVGAEDVLANPESAYVARYALGRDYHKVLRKRLETLAQRIRNAVGEFGYRVFTDSAPVMEVELAEPDRGFFSARSIPISTCPWMSRRRSIAERVLAASTSVRRKPSSPHTHWMHDVAFPISPSSTRDPYPSNCGR